MSDDWTLPEGYAAFEQITGFNAQVGPIYYKETETEYRRAFRVGEHNVNGMGRCHGGMLVTLADLAFGHAVSFEKNQYWVTVRLLTDFIASAELGDFVEGTGEIVGVDGDFYTTRGKLWTGDKILMQGTGVFKALGPRP